MSDRLVRVRRTGGFAGRVREGWLDLDGDDPRAAEASGLVGSLAADSLGQAAGLPASGADRYTYDLDVCGERVRIAEQHLTGDLRRLVDLLLD